MKTIVQPINAHIRQEAQRLSAQVDAITPPAPTATPAAMPTPSKGAPPISKILGVAAVGLGVLTAYNAFTKEDEGMSASLFFTAIGTAVAAWGAYKTARPSRYVVGATLTDDQPSFQTQRQQLVERVQTTCKQITTAWDTLMEAQQAKVRQHIATLDVDSDTRHALMKKVYLYEIIAFATLDFIDSLYAAPDVAALTTALRTCQEQMKATIVATIEKQTAIYDSLG